MQIPTSISSNNSRLHSAKASLRPEGLLLIEQETFTFRPSRIIFGWVFFVILGVTKIAYGRLTGELAQPWT
jgi:hypothetical protein